VNAIASSLNSVGYLGPLFLRVGVGVVMAWHGWQKLDGGVSNFAAFVESLGIPAPTLTAYVVTVIELVGGTALIFGVLTRVAASLIAIEMALTGFWVKPSKLQAPFIGTEGTGFELDVALMVGALALALLGPGRLSVDHATGFDRAADAAPPAYTEAA
jgi:putative oxidoreductase